MTQSMSVYRQNGVDYTIDDPTVAPVFVDTASYTAGQYVKHAGNLYRFTSDHAAGAWTGSDATQVTASQEISDLKSALNQNAYLMKDFFGPLVQGNIYVDPVFRISRENNRVSCYPVRKLLGERITIEMNDGYNIVLTRLNDDLTKISGISWTTTMSYNPIGDSRICCFAFRKDDNSNVTPEEIAQNIKCIYIEPFSDNQNHVLYHNGHYPTAIGSILTEQGSLGVEGLNYTQANTRRTRLLRCKPGDHIKCITFNYSNTVTFIVFDNEGRILHKVLGSGQNSEINIDYTFPEGACFFALSMVLYGDARLSFQYDSVDNLLRDQIEKNTTDAIKSAQIGLKLSRKVSLNYLFENVREYPSGEILNNDNAVGIPHAYTIDWSVYSAIRIIIKDTAISVQVNTGGWGKPTDAIYVFGKIDYITFMKSDSLTFTLDEFNEKVEVIGYYKYADFEDHELSIALEKSLSAETVEKIVGGYVRESDGGFSISTNQNLSGTFPYLPCVPGDSIEWSFGLQTTSVVALATFDEDGKLVNTVHGLGVNNFLPQSHTFTENERFFAMSIPKTRSYLRYKSHYSYEDGVPKYCITERDAAIGRINKALGGINGPTLQFIFSTDQHFSPRIKKMDYVRYGLRMARDISLRTPTDFICLGGDAASYADSYTPETIIEDIGELISEFEGAPCPVVSVAGNHDAFQNTDKVTMYQMYSAHFKRTNHNGWFDWCVPEGTNAYKDFKDQKIRFIFVDTNRYSNEILGQAKEYLKANLESMPDDYTAIITGHQPMLSTLPTPPYYNQIVFDSAILPYKDKIEFIVLGHSHRDGVYVDDSGITCVNVASGLNEGYYDAKIYSAKETAFDTFIFDKENKVLNVVRYGYGYDRKIALTGDLVTVKYELANAATNNNTTMRLHKGSSYDDLISGVTGTVKVTMSGRDITSSAYADGKITIAELTGDVVIAES